MKVLITGATGFTGNRVLREILKHSDIEVSLFVRKTSSLEGIPKDKVQLCYGDLDSRDELDKALNGMDGLINVASIGFGHCQDIVTACENQNVKRVIFVGTTAVFTTLPAQTKKVRLEAEKAIFESNLDWTLVRPTMIYGFEDDRNMIRLVRWIKKYPIVFIPGDGKSYQQPIFVEDLAKAIVSAFLSEKTIKKSYNLSGKQKQTFNEVVDTVAKVQGRSTLKLHIPLNLIYFIYGILSLLPFRTPISKEQIQRLNEDKSFDHDEAKKDFHFNPISFEEGIRHSR
ncbi:MAG: SDR family oxidoreductase [Bacteriovoracaceae bacterium]